MHGHDAVTNLLQERDRIKPANKRIRRIVLNAKMWRVDLLDDLEKNVLGLRELWISPRAIFVVILHAQHDIVALGVLEGATNALDRARDAVLAQQPRISLTAQRAAVTRTKTNGQIDRRPLPLDLSLSLF